MSAPCQHQSATEKFERYYQTNLLVGESSQIQCETCREIQVIPHAAYRPGQPKASRLVPIQTAPPQPEHPKPETPRKGKR